MYGVIFLLHINVLWKTAYNSGNWKRSGYIMFRKLGVFSKKIFVNDKYPSECIVVYNVIASHLHLLFFKQ